MKTYGMLAPGFEIVEATLPIDIMRRAGIDVQTVSITPFNEVEASNGVVIVADLLLEDTNLLDGDMIYLPGGMPGATNLSDCDPLNDYIMEYNAEGKWLAAICAAPLVFGRLGLLKGKNATCYPGFEPELKGATPLKQTVVRDKNIITGCGPGAGFAIGHQIVSVLINENTADTILKQMMFQVYD